MKMIIAVTLAAWLIASVTIFVAGKWLLGVLAANGVKGL